MTHRYHDALLLLKAAGAADIPHSGRSLLDHLLGTHALLTYWDADEDTCLAGLLHSVYRTRSGTILLAHPPQRSQVVNSVGEHAAELIDAYGSSSLARPLLPGGCQNEQDAVAVCLIILANLVDQTIYLPHTCLPLLSAHADTYREVFSQQVNDWIAKFIPLAAKALEGAMAGLDSTIR